MKLQIEWIKKCIRGPRYYYSKHGDIERQNDNLTFAEIEEALLQGSILEHYPDTGRGLSCLMVGFTKKGKPVHIVCGRRGDTLVVITVYIPSAPKFKTPYERG
jgi:hypothetical protein